MNEKSSSFDEETIVEEEVSNEIHRHVGWRSKRRSILLNLRGWCGWNKLKQLYDNYPDDKTKRLFCLFFVSGGRASEVISLSPKQFIYNDEAIKIEAMPVLKYRRKTSRNVLCPIKDDFLAQELIRFLENYPVDSDTRIFPYTRKWAHVLMTRYNPDIWLHWIRGQRAFNLHVVHGFNIFQLKDWFNWKDWNTPLWYIRQSLTEFAKDFGIKNVPSRE